VTLKRLLCFVSPHLWVPSESAADNEKVLVLECNRCGCEHVFSDTFEAESWLERWGRRDIAQSPYLNARHSDPWFHVRRR
jgi:hypothetical protein